MSFITNKAARPMIAGALLGTASFTMAVDTYLKSLPFRSPPVPSADISFETARFKDITATPGNQTYLNLAFIGSLLTFIGAVKYRSRLNSAENEIRTDKEHPDQTVKELLLLAALFMLSAQAQKSAFGDLMNSLPTPDTEGISGTSRGGLLTKSVLTGALTANLHAVLGFAILKIFRQTGSAFK